MFVHSETVALSVTPQDSDRNDHIVVSVALQANRTAVRAATLQHVALALERSSRTARVPHALLFPRKIRKLLWQQQEHDGRLARVLLQWSSSSSSTYPASSATTSTNDLEGPLRHSPAGVTLTVEFVVRTDRLDTTKKLQQQRQSRLRPRFQSVLRTLVGERIWLAPLEDLNRRLDRHVVVMHHPHRNSHNDTVVQFKTTLPLEGALVSAEGLHAFQSSMAAADDASSCTLDRLDPTEMSRILMGDDPSVSNHHRRSLWMDLQSTCHDGDHHAEMTGCQVALSHGMQYSVSVSTSERGTALSQLLPSSIDIQPCPMTDSSMVELSVGLPATSRRTRGMEARLHNVSTMEQENDGLTTVRRYPFHNVTTASRLVLRNVNSSSSLHIEGQATSIPYWHLERTLQRPRGVANEGRLLTRTVNAREECPTRIHVVELLPTYLRPDWSSLTNFVRMHDDKDNRIIPLERDLYMESDGTMRLEWTATLPPHATAYSSIRFDPAFLPFFQFPGDPNRGLELPPAVAYCEALCDDHAYSPVVPLYSDPLLLLPPVPDMSMPFNVISLTCTLYAFVIGSLVNLLVRKSSERIKYKLHPELKAKSTLETLKERIRSKFGKRKMPKSLASTDDKSLEVSGGNTRSKSD